MQSSSQRLSLRDHLTLGLCLGGLFGLLQGVCEGAWICIRTAGQIVTIHGLAETQILVVNSRLFGGAPQSGFAGVLDHFFGPGLADRLSLVSRLSALYVPVGLAGGLALALGLALLARSSGRRSLPPPLHLYACVLLSITVFANLVVWLNGRDVIPTLAPAGLVVNLSLLLSCSLLLGALLRLPALAVSRTAIGWKFAVASAVLLVLPYIGASMLGPHLVAATLVADNGAGDLQPANVLLISIDSLRADHLASYGYPRPTSPNIDALAATGIRFANAFSSTSWTLPSHASMFTSMQAESHGVITHRDRLDDAYTTLAEVLSERGYTTGAFVAAPYLNSSYGLDQGFEFYDDDSVSWAENVAATNDRGPSGHQGVTSPIIVSAATRWLSQADGKAFFAFVHLWDVHYDYAPPPPFDTLFDPDYEGRVTADVFTHNPRIHAKMRQRDLEHIEALYDGEIAFTDLYVGALLAELEQLGSLKETLVVLTSDHGDEFFEHGRKGHGKSLYDEVLHVPLIIRLPSGPNGLVFDELASTLDIAPTILDYLGFGVPRSMQGRSLVPSSEEDTGWADRLTFSRLKERSAGARSSRFKLVQSFNPVRQEFYDLTADPGEHENLVGRARGSTRTALRAHRFELLRWLREQRAIHDSMGIARGAEISESLRQELEALGYID